jgi:hypothetical protein
MIFSVPDLVSMKIYLFLEVLFGGRKNGEATRIWQIDTTLLQNPMVCISVYLFINLYTSFFLYLFTYLSLCSCSLLKLLKPSFWIISGYTVDISGETTHDTHIDPERPRSANSGG